MRRQSRSEVNLLANVQETPAENAPDIPPDIRFQSEGNLYSFYFFLQQLELNKKKDNCQKRHLEAKKTKYC